MSSDITVAGDPLAAPARLALAPAAPVCASVARLAALAAHHAARVTAAQVRYDPTTRWYQRLASAVDHEVWLLSWLPGQGADRHDHGGSIGVFGVVAGRLHERTWDTRDEGSPGARPAPRTRLLGPGTLRVLGRHHRHEVLNTDTEPAVSVHVYAPALTAMTVYPTGEEIPQRTAEGRNALHVPLLGAGSGGTGASERR